MLSLNQPHDCAHSFDIRLQFIRKNKLSKASPCLLHSREKSFTTWFTSIKRSEQLENENKEWNTAVCELFQFNFVQTLPLSSVSYVDITESSSTSSIRAL